MSRKLSLFSVILVAVMVLAYVAPASAQGLYVSRISFDGYADDTPETALGIPGVSFADNGWKTRLLTNPVGDGSIVSLYVLRNRIVGSAEESFRTLTITFDEPLRYYKFGYATIGDYDATVNGYMGGALVFSRVYDSTNISGDAFGNLAEGNDIEYQVLEIIIGTKSQDVIIDDIVTDTSFADGRINANPARDWAPAHVDYCQDSTLIVRLPDGVEAHILPFAAFLNPPASGFNQIAFNAGIYVDQAATGYVFITGFQYDPYWPNNGKPYVIRINQDCTEVANVSPFTPADYNP